MSLYPSLEDAKVDKMAHAEVAAVAVQRALQGAAVPIEQAAAAGVTGPYAGLMSEMASFDSAFGDLAITETTLAMHMPADHVSEWLAQTRGKVLATVTPASEKGIARAAIRQGVREVTLAKGADGKLGLAVDAWDKGVFVAFVWKDSAAAMGGLRFGDQILEIDDVEVAGLSAKKALKLLKDAEETCVRIAVKDRPFMRIVTCQKDAANHCGFLFKDGKITAIVKDTSAARNGMMTNHQIVEVNGVCAVGLKDKELLQVLRDSPMTCTVTITPRFVYDHLIKKISFKRIKGFMDHSIPADI
jgi:syntenin-1